MSSPKEPLIQSGGVVTYGTWSAGESQPDWTMNIDGRGLLEGTFKKHYPSNMSIGGAAPQKGSKHPMDGRMICYKSSAQFDRMGRCLVTAEYIGLAKDPTEAEWEITSTTGSESVVFHPNFPKIAMSELPTPKNNYNYKYNTAIVETDPSNPKTFVKFKITAPYSLAGVDSYLQPKGVVRSTFYTANKSLVAKILGNIAHTAGSPLYVPSSVLPSNGGNYLLTNASISEYGTVYKVSTEWTQSSHGEPWNTFLYQAYGAGEPKRGQIGGIGPMNQLYNGSTAPFTSIRDTAPYTG